MTTLVHSRKGNSMPFTDVKGIGTDDDFRARVYRYIQGNSIAGYDRGGGASRITGKFAGNNIAIV